LILGVLLAGAFAPRASTARADAPADPSAPRRVKVLFLGDNGHHQPMERCRQVYSILGQHGIDLTYTDRMADLNPATLGGYDVLMLYANVTKIATEQEKALLEFVESGHGFAVIHCGSYCFLNSAKITAVIGGRFKSHHTGVFKETIAQPEHPIEKGLKPIESFDETYVHEMHNEKDRTVLGYRVEGDRKEPYTWVRNEGKGRVFYTAWGHDDKTWGNEDFQALLERGIRWSAGDWAFQPLADSQFTYSEADIAIYSPRKGSLGAPKGRMQGPVSPQESIKHLVVPPCFEAKLVCSDPQIKKPICMAFDERGRLWIAETVDYPNNLQAGDKGHDQITLCESSKNDGVIDKFTVFADHLSIPTSMCFANGGLIVQQAPYTLFLKDTTGSGHADVRKILFTGWGTGDTHAGPSNLHYGFDNWIYGTVGYSGFNGEINGQHFSFGMGCYRFKPDGSKFEFLGSTTNNTWGLGLTEDNQVFGSTANNNPSWYLPIPNRYYEQVKGMSSGRLEMICDTPHFWPITEHVRQVDCFGAYTAGTGHEIYTARSFPQWYWNRVAFVAEPTGHLLGQFELEPKGAGFTTRNHFNLAASDDEWTAPIAAMTGPDGAVWMIDWYNFIVQHNPTPRGLITGKGGAYESPLRDKRHGRIYRIIWKDGKPSQVHDLSKATAAELVTILKSDNLLWRMHAQRLLVEKQDKSILPALIALAGDASVDEIGLNPAVIHALWTIHGLGGFDGTNAETLAVAVKALKHQSAGVRKAAIEVLPATDAALTAIIDSKVLNDRDLQVRKAALLALSEMPQSQRAGELLFAASHDKRDEDDRWLSDATSIAACQHDAGFLKALFAAHPGKSAPTTLAPPVAQVNLIPNPSFEEVNDKAMPKAWHVRHYHGEATHVLDHPGFIGSNCLRIESTSGSDTSVCIDVPVDPQSTYTLSAWIKTKGIKGAVGALLNVHGTPFKTSAVTGTSDWKHIALTFNTGQLTMASINCLFGGWGNSTGVAWYDDVELIKQHGSSLPGTEGRVTATVIGQYARRGPVDSIVATLSALKQADAALAVEVIGGLAADWPANKVPQLSDADAIALRALMQSLPAAAKDRLLALAGRWGKHDLFPEQSESVVKALSAEVTNAALDGQNRADAARRLISVLDSPATIELLLGQISPTTAPDVQLGILAALGESNSADIGTSLTAQWSRLTPSAQKAALNLMLRKSAWTGALLDGIQSGKINAKDVQQQQWQVLTSSPDDKLASRAKKLQKSTGGAPSADRAAIVKKMIHLADEPGNAARGQFVFEKNCMVCHTLGDKGGKVGPELTGIGLRPKSDILLQVLDPNRAVEGNFRQWIVKTKTDVLSGRICAESKTNIEIMDATGQIHHVLREEILVLKPTEKGIMPEGLEAIPEQDIRDLLEYLSLSKVKR
jgi:putative membrane-bound dehydrogenase-like protein